MNEFKEYLANELSKLNTVTGPLKIQIVDPIGRKTNYINLPHTTAELLEALNPAPRVEIIGRRWRDVNGNTYHTASVYVNGLFYKSSPITYGYDRQYFETGKKLAVEEGQNGPVIDGGYTDVKRKRDL